MLFDALRVSSLKTTSCFSASLGPKNYHGISPWTLQNEVCWLWPTYCRASTTFETIARDSKDGINDLSEHAMLFQNTHRPCFLLFTYLRHVLLFIEVDCLEEIMFRHTKLFGTGKEFGYILHLISSQAFNSMGCGAFLVQISFFT